jgi:phosphoribosylglycinamide formyltransferase-1
LFSFFHHYLGGRKTLSKRILVLASGTGSLANAVFRAHAAGQISADFIGLISDKDAPVLQVAKSFEVPTFFIPLKSDRTLWDEEIFGTAETLAPDLVVSLGFMRLLAPRFVQSFSVINTHPSLLPLFPGAHAVREALRAGVEVSGTTVHWVDTGLDTGAIICQESVPVLKGDDESALHERIKIAERALIVETLARYGQTGKL